MKDNTTSYSARREAQNPSVSNSHVSQPDARPITVYPLPPQLPTNPYLDQLYAPMADLGVLVRRGRPRYELLRLLLQRGPRILHLHFFDELTQRRGLFQTAARSVLFLILLAVLRRAGVRVVWTAHNLEPHETYHPTWAFLTYRCVARWGDYVIAHSQAARAQLEARYGALARCVVIPHGSYIGRAGPPHERAASRAALGLPLHGPVLLNFGALRPYKGIEDLLAAFAQLPQPARGTLLIAGAAKDRAYATAIARQAAAIDGVRLLPRFIPEAELPLYLAAADLVVLPYHAILTSGVLLWALSHARPVVAPAFGPVGELVREGQEGFLFAAGEPDALRAAIERALAHPDLHGLGQQGLAVARAFDWPTIAAATARCYRAVFHE